MDVKITENFRMETDGMQFIVKERHIVDPTKSPNWDEMKRNGADPTPREEWKVFGYYSLTTKGLRYIFDTVLIKSVARSEAKDLREFSAILRDVSKEITDALEGVITRPK